MTEMTLPSGAVFDFGDLSKEEIADSLTDLRNEKPELFMEGAASKRFDYSAATEEEIEAYFAQQKDDVSSPPPPEATNPGEVESAGFQFRYGRADTIGDKAKRLESEFGPGSYQQVEGTDKFFLLLDNISPEIKKEYNLPDTGTIYANEPGFSWYDVSAGAGAEAGPLTAALAAGLVFSGAGLIPAMVLMAGAGAAGKAFDEFIIEDRLEKMNTQSDDEVWGDVAMTGAFYGLGEGIMRGLWAAGRRVLKGAGPRPDPAKIAELMKGPNKMGRVAATKIAREQAKTELRGAVKEGARPTVTEVSQKAIMGRMQSIYEGIFPNAKAAAKNFEFVQNTLKDLGAGVIDDATAKSLLSQQTQAISAQVANAMKNANVDEAARLANQHLQKVIDNEFKVLLDMYDPKVALKSGWQDTANLSARLFDQDSSILYKKSEDLLSRVIDPATKKSAALFNAQPLQDAVRVLEKNEALKYLSEDAFNKGLFKYIKGKEEFTLTELTNLRIALRSAGKDPALMPGMNDGIIGKLTTSIDDSINNRLDGLVYLRSDAGRKMAERAGGAQWDEATTKLFEDGVMAWKTAQNFHSKGIERFKSFSEQLLEKDIRSGVTLGSKEVLERVVREGQPDTLLRYLKSVTPSGRAVEGIQTVPQSVFDDAARAASAGEFKVANKILDDAGVSAEIVKRLPAFVEKLKPIIGADGIPKMDPYGRMLASEFSDTIRNLGRMAEARANPLQFRNRIRDSLAREWLEQNYTTSKVAGEFSPSVFASRVDQLGKGLQDTLFGKENSTALRQLMKDYHKVGMSNKAFANATAEALGSTASAIRARSMGLTGGRSVSDEIANVQSVMREAERQSEDALFQAFAKGKIDDADSLVLNILKNPKNYDRLVRDFGPRGTVAPGLLDLPAGVKDMVMGRIMEAAFPQGVLPDVVASGAWGAPMRRQLTNLNRNGALAKVLGDGDSATGQLVVNDLIKASKIGERISDQALKGKQGLASAAFAAGAGMRLLTNPLAFAGEAVGIFAMGRIMRQQWFLNSLLKPRYSAGIMGFRGGRRLLQAGRRAGADLEGVSPLGLELRERVAQELRLVAAALGEGQVGSDTREDVSEFVRETITEPVRSAIQQGVPALPATPPPQQVSQAPPVAPQQVAQGADALRQLEYEKMLGVA
jgi:hypothetical protein|tara:strand:- start:12726 stop:16202 length:3477 start_codon:yes stop_codon:yes gene_type:complete